MLLGVTQKEYDSGNLDVYDLLLKAKDFKLVNKNGTDYDGFNKFFIENYKKKGKADWVTRQNCREKILLNRKNIML